MEDLGKITSVSEFLSNTAGVHDHSREENRFFCRGQGSMQVKLKPKIGRYGYAAPLSRSSTPEWKRKFDSMFSQFERDYTMHHPSILNRKMDRLTLAQHYGLATQLLDWTLNPLIALYFACLCTPDEDGIVFIFSPFLATNIMDDSDLDAEVKWQTFRPTRLDQRMINQDTAFTYHGDPTTDFADQLGEKLNGVVIDKRAKIFILRELASIGIHKAFVFPTLESICSRIDDAHKSDYTYAEDKKFYPDKVTSGEEGLADEREPYLK